MLYPDDIEYLKTYNRRITLPKGEPIGRGNLIFLLSWDLDESIKMINSKDNFMHGNRYFYYYFTYRYLGMIKGRKYNIRSFEERKSNYERIEKETRLTHYPLNRFTKKDIRNTYFDLYKYMQIFFTMTEKLVPSMKMKAFWEFFLPIFKREDFQIYHSKYILIDANNYTNFSGPLKETMKNPLFILYYTMFRNFDLIKDFDMDFLIYCGTHCMKVNPSKCDEKSYKVFLRELKRLFQYTSNEIDEELSEESITKKEEAENITSLISTKYNFTGSDESEKDTVTNVARNVKPEAKSVKKKEEKITSIPVVAKQATSNETDPVQSKVNDTISKAVSAVDEITPKEKKNSKEEIAAIDRKIEQDLNNDKELIEKIYQSTMQKKVVKSPASSARDEMLRKEQLNLKVKDMTIKDIEKIDAIHMPIPTRDVSRSLRTTNENVKNITFNNFEKTYNEKVMPKDIVNSVLMLNDKSIPLFLLDVKVEDTSDELNYKDTYTFTLEDTNRQRHTIKVDIPKFIDDKFMYLGGNKKLIIKQNFLFPVVKTGPDTVQIVTNYNKMFIRRVDTKSLGSISRLNKLIETNDSVKKYFDFGNSYALNDGYITTIEYDEFSKIAIEYHNNGLHLMFGQKDIEKYATEHNITIPEKQMMIGTINNRPVFIDLNTQKTAANQSICDLIYESLNDQEKAIYNKIKLPKRLMYTKVKTMEQDIPVMTLLCFWEGIDTVLKKAKIEYRLEKTYPANLKPSESVIRFSDCYMVYEDDVPTSLLMNGLKIIPTEKYTIASFDTKEPYIDYFKKVYGKIAIANSLMNSYEFTLDPITIEVLEDINLPTKLVDLMIYANGLLADSQYTPEINQKLYRIRSNEIIPAILYDSIAKNYITFKNSNGKKKLSVPRDIVIKQVLKLKTVEDYSTLNPLLELERTHSVSTRGWRGANLDRSYTLEKRTYDPSMIGIMGLSSSPDGSVGVAKTLTVEPCIKTVRGYVDVKDGNEIEKLKDVNLFSPAEMLVPLGVTRDDATRTGHSVKQSKHVIPVKNSSPVLISNGEEESCRFQLSKDFVINAEQDGTIIDYNPKLKLMIAEYKDGTHQAINLAPNIVKNGGGGFFLSNELITDLKVGDKFKKNDILAWHKDFFTKDRFTGIRMNMGTLSKVAIMSTYNTYEDATFVTHKLSRDAASEMVFVRQVVIGKNSNVSFMLNVGDHVEIGDTLVQFDTSYDDSSLNEFLANLSMDPRLKDEVVENSKNSIKSKYAGVIEDIKMYSTVDLDELSSSLKMIFEKYYKGIKEKKKMLESYDPGSSIVKCGLLVNETTKKIEPNKFGVVKGQKVEDSVLIEFYIKHTELLEVGSKIA